ncbi:MAG: hypothetical protein R6V33_11605, partial [Pelovirga sp.]
ALMAVPVLAENPYLQPDNTWITISGEVESVSADAFTLDFGEGVITVEMDDGDRDADGYKLLPGDKVTVSGMIDDDFYEQTTIEASSVYVENLGTTFYASAVDEEGIGETFITPVVKSKLTVRGTVTAVSGDDFVINNGLRSVRVDISELPYNPLDDEGYLKIEVGDFVRATGTMDQEFFEGRQLMADTVVELVD